MKRKITWVLIANGGEARIVETEGRGGEVRDVDGMQFENATPPARDIMADKPGRAFDSAGQGRHAMEYTSDPAEQSELDFARQLSEVLETAFRNKRFDELSIVAAPAMLAKLRQALAPQVGATLRAEIDKDYTKVSKIDLPDYLRRSEAID